MFAFSTNTHHIHWQDERPSDFECYKRGHIWSFQSPSHLTIVKTHKPNMESALENYLDQVLLPFPPQFLLNSSPILCACLTNTVFKVAYDRYRSVVRDRDIACVFLQLGAMSRVWTAGLRVLGVWEAHTEVNMRVEYVKSIDCVYKNRQKIVKQPAKIWIWYFAFIVQNNKSQNIFPALAAGQDIIE